MSNSKPLCVNCGNEVAEENAAPGPAGHVVHEDCVGGNSEPELSTGKRIQNAKMAYDLDVDDHAESECDLCGESKEDVRTTDVQNEADGTKRTVGLCPECRDITDRYNRGEDVKWPEAVSE